MKKILALAMVLCSVPTSAQQLTSAQWEEEAKKNIRLLPKYGHIPKTTAQTNFDKEFILSVLKQDSTYEKASNHMIQLGFNYLYRDIKTAMYRFNQAYLLDSTNTDIYWGFAAVYMTLGDYAKAKTQYLEGLAINPKSTHLLTDYGTYYMAQYYDLHGIDKESAFRNLDSAIVYMTRSYELDPLDQNTSYKLSVCYWSKSDCMNAWKYYEACKLLGGQPITEEYTTDLKKKCN